MPDPTDPKINPEARLQDTVNPQDPPGYDAKAMGLCLSGGGYKAAAYHLGGLIRLNELGVLKGLDRIASVSGGSIAAGYLGLRWKDLVWNGAVATNFDAVFVKPMRTFLTSADIDVAAGLAGLLLPWRSGGDGVQAAYEKHLFGKATLQDLPDEATAPRFVILATNYQLNSVWRFARAYAADYRVGMVRNPNFPLARVVAASSGFPPFFCPINFDLRQHVVENLPGADLHKPPYTERAQLADAGIYDNMGLEPIWKRCGVLLVSNAGDPFDETPEPPTNWLSLLRRTLSMVHRQAENNRVRWLMSMAAKKERKVAYWPLRNTVADYRVSDPVAFADAAAAAKEPVRLKGLTPAACRRLVHHGYSLGDAAVRAYLGVANSPKPVLPNV